MAIFNQLTDILGGAWYPTGSIIMFPSDDVPNGWLKCDGTAYSYTAQGGKYKALYDVIGTTFGAGTEGSSFKVPDMRKRFVEGASSDTGHTLGSYVEAGLPNHNHIFSGDTINTDNTNLQHRHSAKVGGGNRSSIWPDAGYNTGTGGGGSFNVDSALGNHRHYYTPAGTIDYASAHNAVYGKSGTVQPKSLMLNYIIKY